MNKKKITLLQVTKYEERVAPHGSREYITAICLSSKIRSSWYIQTLKKRRFVWEGFHPNDNTFSLY